jgi:CRISPR-associated protein (TIGR02584 family)
MPSTAVENVLIATIGISPAVLTETVWALAHSSPPVLIDRVIVVTTLRGKNDLKEKLLTGAPSTWERLKQVLHGKGLAVQEKLRFLDGDIHVIEANGQHLEDIRSTDDNRAVGNQLLRLLLDLSASPNRTIYASLAGGRKTMSSLLLTAMTMCARTQDRVLHVLVNEPFENPRLDPPFYFPDPDVQYHTYSSNSEKSSISPHEARIELAEIPIPKLREFLDASPERDDSSLTLESVAHIIRRGSEEAVTQRLFNLRIDVDECLKNTPLLRSRGEQWRKNHSVTDLPFSQYHVLMVLHCLGNLVSFTWALQQLGLRKATYFVKEYPYPQKQEILDWLKAQDYQALDLNEDKLRDYLRQIAHEQDPILIVEDGGWITKAILEHFFHSPLRERVVGVMEQTQKGLWRIEDAINKVNEIDRSRLIPILLLTHSKHKSDFEPLHIGRGIVRALDQMIPEDLTCMPVGLFGFGKIGEAVANALAGIGAKVTVYDPKFSDPNFPLFSLRQDYQYLEFVVTPERAVKDKRLVIGCSGSPSINDKVLSQIRSNGKNVYLASGSSDRVEIDLEFLKRKAKSCKEYKHSYLMVGGKLLRLGTCYELSSANIVLLCDGMPVNFMGLGGMKDPAADFIMSLMLDGAYELACKQIEGHGLVCSKDNSCIDRISTKLQIAATYHEILIGKC